MGSSCTISAWPPEAVACGSSAVPPTCRSARHGAARRMRAHLSASSMRSRTAGATSAGPVCCAASSSPTRNTFPTSTGMSGSQQARVSCWKAAATAPPPPRALLPRQTSCRWKVASANVMSMQQLRPPLRRVSRRWSSSRLRSTSELLGAAIWRGWYRRQRPSSTSACIASVMPSMAGCVPMTGMTPSRKFATLPNSSGAAICSCVSGSSLR
mmetsp:Transcript_45971/g.142358  ORF Transcript_45971/g.142358 Transcript_45971/m.142358 type:complete len:212 (+) Transcript_45971:431-1066(+)